MALLVGLIMLALWLADGGLTGGPGARPEARREGEDRAAVVVAGGQVRVVPLWWWAGEQSF